MFTPRRGDVTSPLPKPKAATMARDEAYYEAEKKIEEARRAATAWTWPARTS